MQKNHRHIFYGIVGRKMYRERFLVLLINRLISISDRGKRRNLMVNGEFT